MEFIYLQEIFKKSIQLLILKFYFYAQQTP